VIRFDVTGNHKLLKLFLQKLKIVNFAVHTMVFNGNRSVFAIC